MRCRVLHTAEHVHEFMGFDRLTCEPPAAAVDPRITWTNVVHVAEGSTIVIVERGDPAIKVRVDPDKILAVRLLEAHRLELADRIAVAVVAGRRQLHTLDHEIAA